MDTFNSFSSSLKEKVKEISTTVSQKTQEISVNLPAFAQSTQRLVQERLGQVTDISQLPQEYLELEKKVDAIKMINEHFLQVTSIYETESYDYPKYIKDSVNDFSKIVASKVTELSHVTSASEAQSVLTNMHPNGVAIEPKTLNYALSRVALSSSDLIQQLDSSTLNSKDNKLAKVLLDFSDVQTKVAQERLQQDKLISENFNNRLREELNEKIERASVARKNVQNKRLQYDVARTNLMNAKPEKEAALRVQMETLEDEFAKATEDATLIMQEVISASSLLSNLHELVAAQLRFFENSAALLKEFAETTNFSAESNNTSTGPVAPAPAPASAPAPAKKVGARGKTKVVDDELEE